MRIFLLRLLIGWWSIPIIWLFMLPMFYLFTGNFSKEVKDIKEVSRMIWYGF